MFRRWEGVVLGNENVCEYILQRKAGAKKRLAKNNQTLTPFGKRNHISYISWRGGRTDHNSPWTERSRELKSTLEHNYINSQQNFPYSFSFHCFSTYFIWTLLYLEVALQELKHGNSGLPLVFPSLLWSTLNHFNNQSSNWFPSHKKTGWAEWGNMEKCLWYNVKKKKTLQDPRKYELAGIIFILKDM